MNSVLKQSMFKLMIVSAIGMFCIRAHGQVPDCNLVYVHSETGAMIQWDPAQPFSNTNPQPNSIQIGNSNEAGGLAIGLNLNTTTGNTPTFYTTRNGFYYFYDGATWVNTNHQSSGVNLGGGVGIMYNLNGNTGQVYKYNGNNNCFPGFESDTFTIVPAPKADAGIGDTIVSCGAFTASLSGTLSNTTPWVDYKIDWTPTGSIASGGNTLHPNINPTQSTTYTLTVSTNNTQGNCHVSDSVKIVVKNESVDPGFLFTVKKGCLADTVLFTNTSQNAMHYSWDFGDGSLSDTSAQPIHIYNAQGLYHVKLTAGNNHCTNIAERNVDTRHPLIASFDVDKDVICQMGVVKFTNTSVVSTAPATFNWFTGDGSVANGNAPTHVYNNSGTYNAMLVVTDAIPCSDTAFHTIVVDSIVKPTMELSSRSICVGQSVDFKSAVLPVGAPGFNWNFNDGTSGFNTAEARHAYDNPGVYKVELTTSFRACPESHLEDSVVVHPFPVVNLGPDTAICLDANPIMISNLEAAQPGEQYQWNTGDKTASYLVKHHGTYQLTVTNEYHCSTTDEIEVKKDCYIDIPNSFTPNNDGVNDYFFPRQLLSQGVSGFSMQIFDRWGEKIFETTQTNGRGWDGKFNGKDQPQGVFIYLIQVVLKNGRTEKYNGNVTLIR